MLKLLDWKLNDKAFLPFIFFYPLFCCGCLHCFSVYYIYITSKYLYIYIYIIFIVFTYTTFIYIYIVYSNIIVLTLRAHRTDFGCATGCAFFFLWASHVTQINVQHLQTQIKKNQIYLKITKYCVYVKHLNTHNTHTHHNTSSLIIWKITNPIGG